MTKLLILLASALSCGSFWLADRAVSDLPSRIDVAGRQLRMRVEGTGSPTVVLEIGLRGMLEEWAAVQSKVATFARVAAYDRTGAVRDKRMLSGEDIARELHAALANEGLDPPYVMVGQSFGGIYMRVFANLYPNEVVGLVLLDPSQEDFIRWMELHHPARIISQKDVKDWPEGAGIWSTLRQLKTTGSPPKVPTIVVTGARFIDDPEHIEVLPVWTKSHEDWVRTLPHGRHVIDHQSGHGVQIEDPELAVELIREVVEQSRHRANSAASAAR